MTTTFAAAVVESAVYTPVPVTDFNRPMYCVLGLIFDAISTDGAAAHIIGAVVRQQRCYLATPNVNNVVAARKDDQYRNSISRADLSIADGMPIIWVAKFLGIPITSRVAGSTLFERLREQTVVPVKVFFFGGPDGAAQKAAAALNADNTLMTCVGAISPGFGSIAELSSDAFINQINAAQPDFVVVALGTQRGNTWIEHNLARLDTPVISHLGAVVNFVAGTISRAPDRFANSGLEWLWRIKEEPALWRRYFNDGKVLMTMIATQVLPYFFHTVANTIKAKLSGRGKANASVAASHQGSLCTLTLKGAWHDDLMPEFRRTLTEVTATPCDIALDLRDVSAMNNACVALLILLYGHQSKIKRRLTIVAISSQATKMFHLCGVAYILQKHE